MVLFSQKPKYQLLLRAMWTLGLTFTRFGQNSIGQCFSRIEFVQNAIWSAGVVLTEKDITRFMQFESLVHEQVTGRAMENYFAGWSKQLLPIHNLSQALTERDGQIAHLNQVVAERDRQSASLGLFRVEVLNSISWRFTYKATARFCPPYEGELLRC